MSDVPIPPLNQVVASSMPSALAPTQGISFAPAPWLTPTRALPPGPPPLQSAYGTVFPSFGGGVSSPWPTGAPAGRFGGVPGPRAAPVGQIPQLARPIPPPTAAGVPRGPTSAFPQRALPPAPTAAGAVGTRPAVAPTARGAAGGVSRLSRLGTRAAGAASNLGGVGGMSRLGRVARYGRFAAPWIADWAGDWVTEQTGQQWLGNALEMGLTAGAVTKSPIVAGGAAVAGALGVELEDIPWIGGLFKEGDSVDDIREKANEQFERVLSQYGAPPSFIAQTQRQFDLAYEVAAGDDDLSPEATEQLASDVLTGMIQHWQTQQAGGPTDPYGDARTQLAEARQYDMAQIAATQAWMEPLVTDIVTDQQQYADAYRDAGLALAGQVSDPAVSAALSQMAHGYSSNQAVQNATMLQQQQLMPETMQAQLDAQYQDILAEIAMQEAQYQNEILAAGGTLPGQTPIVGGIPLAPPGAAVPAGQPVAGGGTSGPGAWPDTGGDGIMFEPRGSRQTAGGWPVDVAPSTVGQPGPLAEMAEMAGPPPATEPVPTPLPPAPTGDVEGAAAAPGVPPFPTTEEWPYFPSSLAPNEPQTPEEWADAALAHEAGGSAGWFLRRNWGRLSYEDKLAISNALGTELDLVIGGQPPSKPPEPHPIDEYGVRPA